MWSVGFIPEWYILLFQMIVGVAKVAVLRIIIYQDKKKGEGEGSPGKETSKYYPPTSHTSPPFQITLTALRSSAPAILKGTFSPFYLFRSTNGILIHEKRPYSAGYGDKGTIILVANHAFPNSTNSTN